MKKIYNLVIIILVFFLSFQLYNTNIELKNKNNELKNISMKKPIIKTVVTAPIVKKDYDIIAYGGSGHAFKMKKSEYDKRNADTDKKLINEVYKMLNVPNTNYDCFQVDGENQVISTLFNTYKKEHGLN